MTFCRVIRGAFAGVKPPSGVAAGVKSTPKWVCASPASPLFFGWSSGVSALPCPQGTNPGCGIQGLADSMFLGSAHFSLISI